MAIQDSDAERRNLVLTSIAIITYYVAEGEVTQEVIKLPLINIHFHNITALIVMVWLCLFWFFFRYWLSHRGKFKSGLRDELHLITNHRLSRWYFQHRTNLTLVPEILKKPPNDEKGFVLVSIRSEGNDFNYYQVYRYQDIIRTSISSGEKLVINNASLSFKAPDTGEVIDTGKLTFSGFVGKAVLLVLTIQCFVTQESFGSYLAPYILFSLAVLLGIINAIQLVL